MHKIGEEVVITINLDTRFDKSVIEEIDSVSVIVDISSIAMLYSKTINTILLYVFYLNQKKVDCTILVANETVKDILSKLHINRLAPIKVVEDKTKQMKSTDLRYGI